MRPFFQIDFFSGVGGIARDISVSKVSTFSIPTLDIVMNGQDVEEQPTKGGIVTATRFSPGDPCFGLLFKF